MLKKNDVVTLEITGLTNEGNGVGKADGIAVFVPLTAVGDVIECRIVKVKKSFCYGIIENIITASADRCENVCGAFGKCGGCSFRHISYEAELRSKEEFVYSAFTRIGKLSPKFEGILGSENSEHYRNKVQFPIAADENGRLFSGFYAKRSHRVIRSEECALIPEIFTEICGRLLELCTERKVTAYDEESGRGLLRHVYMRKGAHSGEIMVCIVVTSSKRRGVFAEIAEQICGEFAQIKSFIMNINPDRTNVILGKLSEVLCGREEIYDEMCGNRIAISLHSFYQINTFQAERVYELAREYAQLKPTDTLLDLYCGAGTIGLSMAAGVKKLIGVEIVAPAIDDAKKNAAANGIKNAEFICADAEQAAQTLYERGELPNVIIADPARKGCTPETLKYMAKMSPERIVMISCNPSTAARDCAELEKLGYKAERCKAADFFPRTGHVETVCLLSKKDK